jgi:hypothetical protein
MILNKVVPCKKPWIDSIIEGSGDGEGIEDKEGSIEDRGNTIDDREGSDDDRGICSGDGGGGMNISSPFRVDSRG